MPQLIQPEDLFVFQASYEVLICLRCKYAIRLPSLRYHLRQDPHRYIYYFILCLYYLNRTRSNPFLRLSVGLASDLVARVFEQWPQLRQTPALAELPPTILMRIPELPLYHDGHWCRLVPHCTFVGRTMPSLKDHWSKAH